MLLFKCTIIFKRIFILDGLGPGACGCCSGEKTFSVLFCFEKEGIIQFPQATGRVGLQTLGGRKMFLDIDKRALSFRRKASEGGRHQKGEGKTLLLVCVASVPGPIRKCSGISPPKPLPDTSQSISDTCPPSSS